MCLHGLLQGLFYLYLASSAQQNTNLQLIIYGSSLSWILESGDRQEVSKTQRACLLVNAQEYCSLFSVFLLCFINETFINRFYIVFIRNKSYFENNLSYIYNIM
jgi:hypothetical protein